MTINTMKLNIFAIVLKWVWNGWDIEFDLKKKDNDEEFVESVNITIQWPEDKTA